MLYWSVHDKHSEGAKIKSYQSVHPKKLDLQRDGRSPDYIDKTNRRVGAQSQMLNECAVVVQRQ